MPDQSEIIQKLSVPRYAPRLKPTPIPTAAWNDAPLFCLEVNDEWVSHIIGVMTALDQPDTWLGTEDEIRDARQQVNEIILAFMEACVNNCDCDIPLVRIEDGVYQESDDGGITWHDAPTHDPRNRIPRIPPYPAPDVDGAKCAYADSVVNHFKDGFIDLLEEGQTAEEILGFLTAIAEAVFGPLTGPIGWIIPALLAISTAIVAIGITAVGAAFTPEFWDELRCLILANMQDDGSFTQDNLDAIYAGVPGGAITTVIIDSWLAAIGTTGLTNAAHLAMGSTDADCGCSDVCGSDWIDYNSVTHGHIIDFDEETGIMTVESTAGDMAFWSSDASGMSCCKIVAIDVISGGGRNTDGCSVIHCGDARELGNFAFSASIFGVCASGFSLAVFHPTTLAFHFQAC